MDATLALGSLVGSNQVLMQVLGETAPDLGRAVGRLHPLVVHFPIALAIVAVAAEWWRSLSRREGLSPLTRPLLWLAAVAAVFAAGSGWFNAMHEHGGDEGTTLALHRWIGIGTAIGLLLTAAWCQSLSAALVRPSASAIAQLGAFRWTALIAGISVAVTGHLGGELTHGSNYLGKVLFPGSARGDEPEESGGSDGSRDERAPVETPIASAVSLTAPESYFVDKVYPILESHCFECHGPRKQKGGLRMDSRKWLFNGDEQHWTVIPGKPTESDLLSRVTLGRDDPDAMPPEGPGLTQDEIAVLKKWIEDGAAYPSTKSGTAPAPGVGSSASSAALTTIGTIAIAGGSNVEFAADVKARAATAGHALSLRGVLIQPIAMESELVDVNASRADPSLGDADAGLIGDLAPLIANLNLSRTAITDAGLARIGPMAHVERLRVDQTAVGDEGLAALGTLPRLESINLVGSKVTPASVAWLVQQPALRRVYVWQTALDNPDAIGALRAGGRIEAIGADLPLAQPKTPPMPEDAKPAEKMAEATTDAKPDGSRKAAEKSN